MKLRNIWLIILIFTSIISIGINTLVLSHLTRKYFTEYLEEVYSQNVEDITEYAKTALESDYITSFQIEAELENYLDDPISEINLYNSENQLIISVESELHMGRGMMNEDNIETRELIIESEGEKVGTILLKVQDIEKNSFVAANFRDNLLENSLFSILIAMMISVLAGIIISYRMTRSLKETAKMATNIQMGEDINNKDSGIKEVQAIRESLNELSTRLNLKQRSRKALIDELVHQTQTPLAILKSHIEAIEDGIIKADKNELSTCNKQVDYLSDIITNISVLIDAQKDFDNLDITSFDIVNNLKQISGSMSAQFLKKNLTLDFQAKEPIYISSDKFKLNQAIYNILTNAYKYTPNDGQIIISCNLSEEYIIIKISDSGIGIDGNDKDRIFNAYYRGTNTENIKGDGLGLFIAKENIEQLKGEISVESKKGKGSTFIIKMPLSFS